MKRSLGAVEGHHDKMPRRQDAVSCQFCRTKKLKCDRQYPCSNCRARKLACVSSTDESRAASLVPGASNSYNTPRNESSRNLDELNARLKRLEELLAAKELDLPSNKESNSLNYEHEPLGEDLESSRNMCKLEADAFQHQALDSKFFTSDEKIGHIFSASFLSFDTPALRIGMDQKILSLLPSRKQAIFLFDYYIEKIVSICYVIHIPSVRRMLNTLYTKLDNNTQPQHDHVALLSTIFALSAYFSPPLSTFRIDGVEAKSLSYQWIFVAQRALLAANYIIEPTVETLQSVILIALHLLPNIGAMATSRTLRASALLGAQQLSLHRLDSLSSKKLRENTQVDWVEVEVKRRIWWYLASTEWVGAYMSGPQWGTYMIDPKHMQVDWPTNVDDIDINSSGIYGRSLDDDTPTDMTHFLLRVKLSIGIREIVDIASNAGYTAEDELPYDLVLLFDKKINKSIKDFVPVISRSDSKGSLQHIDVEKKMPKLSFLRLIGQFLPQTKLTLLHRPYLARGARDPKYAYSRMVCLRSARFVIELGKKIIDSDGEFVSDRLWTIIHPFFVSVLVLVMDYSLNRNEPRADERKAEILDSFKWLEASQENSMLAKQALRQLRELLSKGVAKSAEAKEDSSPIQANSSPSRPNSPDSHTQQVDPQSLTVTSNSQHRDGHPFYQPGQELQDPLSQYNWSDMDRTPVENLNFDVELDETAITVLPSLVSTLLPLAGLSLYDDVGVGWGNSLLSSIGLLLAPTGFLIIRYGEFLRKKYAIKHL